MNIELSLFEGERICLGPLDLEKDPQIERNWTHDPYYLRMLGAGPARPMSAAQIKKNYESIEKDQEEKGDQFYFALRMKADDRPIGFARLYAIEWSNGVGRIQLGIGDSADRGCRYGTEALRLLLRFAFDELNLYRLTALIVEYNDIAKRLFTRAGFVEEVRRREAVFRDGKRWDLIHMGLVREELHDG